MKLFVFIRLAYAQFVRCPSTHHAPHYLSAGLKHCQAFPTLEHPSLFLREIVALSQITHPAAVDYLGVTVWGGSVAIVTEYLTGGDLQQRIEGGAAFLVWERASVGAQVAAALEYVHLLGIAHGDVKPRNVFLSAPASAGGPVVAKLGDFGLASAFGTAHESHTLRYAPPEVLKRTAGSVAAAGDVYSLGLTLFETLAREKGLSAKARQTDPDALPIRPAVLRRLGDRLGGRTGIDLVTSLVVQCVSAEATSRPTVGVVADVLDVVAANAAALAQADRVDAVGQVPLRGRAAGGSCVDGSWFGRRRPGTDGDRLSDDTVIGASVGASGHVRVFHRMVDAGLWAPSFNQPAVLAAARASDTTALISAILANDHESARLLDGAPAEADEMMAATLRPPSALMAAAEAGHSSVVSLLLASGARADLSYGPGRMTPLHAAAEGGWADVVRCLLGAPHIDGDARTSDGFSALHLAASGGHADCTAALLACPAVRVNAVSLSDGASPLILAAARGHTPVVRLLLDAGADPNVATAGSGTTGVCARVCVRLPGFVPGG